MFNGFHTMSPTDAELANAALHDEGVYQFPSFSASDAVTLGLSLRKRFRASARHSKGKGLVLSIQSIAGHTLFACTVGDLGHVSGVADVSLDSWTCLEGMINVVKRTGHSSYYVEKGISAMGKTSTPNQILMGIQNEFRVHGGAFPIWLENGHCCPIAVVACYSGSSHDDHTLVVTTIRDYLNKLRRSSEGATTMPAPSVPPTADTRPESSEWPEPGPSNYHHRPDSVLEHVDDHV